ncbi:zinc-binding dehydrogenase [Streptomyces mirabilis]|uniref:zinc-binding dehydrogenase n=1 Tax=Streptomyces mirabilis TaxID=68239 RepID=UPI0036321E33
MVGSVVTSPTVKIPSVLTLVAFDAADTGIQVHMSAPGERGAQALRDILSLMEKGRLRVPIWRTFPLAEAADALQVSQAGHLGGKIVLLPA